MARSPKIHVYRTFNWIDRDPVVEEIFSICRNEHLNNNRVHEISGVASQTLNNWFGGKTRKPQHTTVCAVTSALGYVRADSLDRDGNLRIGYKKARDLDYRAEIEKQGSFLLKHGTVKQQRAARRKTKGGG